MLSLYTSLMVYMVEMLISYVFFSYIFEKKLNSPAIFLIGILIFASGAFVNYASSNTVWINLIYTLISNWVFAFLCFRMKFRSAAFYSLVLAVLSFSFELATIFLISAISGAGPTEYNSNPIVLFVEVVISKTLYFIFCILLVGLHKTKREVSGRISPSFYFYPLCSLLVFITFWYISIHETLSPTNQTLLIYTSIALLGATVILFITYRHNVEKDIDYMLVKSENRKLQTEKEYYDILDHQNQQLMAYAHDAKNHLSAIRNLSENPQINEYIKKLSDQLKEYAYNCHSGNKILDVVINKYVTECKMHKVNFSYDVKSSNLNNMEDIDLVAVLGNLMDNALRAARQSKEKHISLATTWRNSYSVIIIANSSDTKPLFYGKRLLSTKENGNANGFGLRSVGNTLKKYGGDFDWEYNAEKHIFSVTVMVGEKRQADFIRNNNSLLRF